MRNTYPYKHKYKYKNIENYDKYKYKYVSVISMPPVFVTPSFSPWRPGDAFSQEKEVFFQKLDLSNFLFGDFRFLTNWSNFLWSC